MTLKYGQSTWIVARDPAGFVLLGGLGSLGVGEMWVAEQTYHAEYEGYENAPCLTRPHAGFGEISQ